MKAYENTFNDFSFLFELLKDSFIIRYREYDNRDKIYLRMEHCIPFIHEIENGKHLRVFEMQTGKSKEFFSNTPIAFEFGSYRFYQRDCAKIFIHLINGHTLSFYIKKKNVSS